MNRKIKEMYSEMLLNSIVNDKWRYSQRDMDSLLFDEKIEVYTSPKKRIGNYSYEFKHDVVGIFSKKVKVYVGEHYESKNTDELVFSIFSKLYWRLLQMDADYKQNVITGTTNIFIDTYKAFKKDIDEKSILELEQSIVNLSKIEEEYKEKLKKLVDKE